jgi:outer membrane receptor protein involved in Fe transport
LIPRDAARWLFALANLFLGLPVLAQAQAGTALAAEDAGSSPDSSADSSLEPMVVTQKRLGLIGTASSASEGVVVNDELELAPAFRPGQLLETVPGLDVTSHSGEGKANQYLMRGYNLDHGTQLAVFVDGMPVNEPSHAHGQGYTDLNFMIPELATDIRYTKGTYYPNVGDFGSVGSIRIGYVDTIDATAVATAGTLGFERVFAGGSTKLADGNLLAALELQHYDGPWVNPDDQRKANAVLRYSQGNRDTGYSLTAMFYNSLWNSTTDQPERAVTEGLIPRFGSLDPTDGGQAQRASLTGQSFAKLGSGRLAAGVYAFSNHLTLWNDFTHFLVDPVNGDQEAQHEDRTAIGASVSYAVDSQLLGYDSELLAGVQLRYDFLQVSRTPSRDREPIPAQDHPLGARETDKISLGSNALFAQATTHWNAWLRTVVGLREDYQQGSDAGTNDGDASSALFEPKGSLIVAPAEETELYVSAGRGFHSDDIRGVNQARSSGLAGAPLIAAQMGEEIGLRQALWHDKGSLTLALFNLDSQSETTYDPDVGQDTAGPASRRSGYEINITYQALHWLEFYASLSQDRARFKTPYNDGTGHVGEFLPNAPFATGSCNVYVKNLGRWSGGVQYRYLGAYPLSSDDAVQGSGYGEWNGDVRYRLGDGWNATLGIYNILNRRGNAMEYWYVDRISRAEPMSGVADIHVHPLEPITARVTITRFF